MVTLTSQYEKKKKKKKVFWSLYCFTTSICHGVENYFPRLWGTGISDPIRASTDHFLFFFVSRLSSVVAQRDEYLSTHLS